MLLAVRRDLWNGILQRYGQGHYLQLRKLNIDPHLPRPNILGLVEFQPQFTYDAVRLFPNHKATRLVPVNGSQCPHCYHDDLRYVHAQGYLVCSRCGSVLRERMTVSEMDSLSHGTSTMPVRLPRRHSDNLSKRINHFKYWLLRLQGRETTRVTVEDLNRIKEIVAARPVMSVPLFRDLLRCLKFQKYYNNIYYLFHVTTGTPLPEFTADHEKQLLAMFRSVQTPFAKHRGRRVNMLSYLYLIRKFAEILGWEEFAETLEQLKSREKLKLQDRIWKRICDEVGFPYYASV